MKRVAMKDTGMPQATQKATRPLREQKEDRHDQDETAGPVGHEEHDAIADQLPGGIVDDQLDPRREQGTCLGEPLVEHLGRRERVARLGTLQDHLDRGASVHREPQGRIARHPLDLGDIAELQVQRLLGLDRDLRELERIAALVEAAQLARRLASADRPGGKVATEGADPLADLRQPEPQLFELRLVDLDADLFQRKPADLHLVDPALEQLGLEAARQMAQLVRRSSPVRTSRATDS
jgi:hypothetical protein